VHTRCIRFPVMLRSFTKQSLRHPPRDASAVDQTWICRNGRLTKRATSIVATLIGGMKKDTDPETIAKTDAEARPGTLLGVY